MAAAGPCSCKLELGCRQISTQELLSSQELERKCKLVDETINFLGPANTHEQCTIMEKINEIREKCGKYYFNKDNRLIAIPNMIGLPKKPFILEGNTKTKQNIFLDKQCEDLLHQTLIIALRNLQFNAFIMQGFQSGDVLKVKLEKGTKLRSKNVYAELNKHEKEVMEILGVKDIAEDTLAQCIQLHKDYLNTGRKGEHSTWLFDQVLKREGKNGIRSKSDEMLKRFYIFQHYYFNCIQEASMEYDSLILLPEFKLIINIEVKRGSKANVLQNAADQTEKHLSFFTRVFGSLLSTEWKFIKAACIPNLISEKKIPCNNCSHFLVKDKDIIDIEPWLSNITKKCKLFKAKEYDKEYENLMVGLIGFKSIRESGYLNNLILNPHGFSRQTQMQLVGNDQVIYDESLINRNQSLMITNDQIRENSDYLFYMLNPEQLAAVECTSPFIIINGDYGTGKTFVLKEKAKQCASDHPTANIAFINLSPLTYYESKVKDLNKTGFIENSVMDKIAWNEFKEFQNIIVITCKVLFDNFKLRVRRLQYKPTIYDALIYYLSISKHDHVFIDELPPVLFDLPDLFQDDKSFCVTMKCDEKLNENKNEEWINAMTKQFNATLFDLTINMRNTQNVIALSRAFNLIEVKPDELLNPEKNIIGPICYWYDNHQYGLDKHLIAEALVKKYFSSNPEETVFILFDKNYHSEFKSFQKRFNPTTKVTFIHKGFKLPHEFWKNPKGIIVTDIESFGGAQARNIIIFSNYSNVSKNNLVRNMILRTMSFAIVVTMYPMPNPVSSMIIRDTNLHEYVLDLKAPVKCYHIENCYQGMEEYVVKAIINEYWPDLNDTFKPILILANKKEQCQKIGNYLTKLFKGKLRILMQNVDYVKRRLYGDINVICMKSSFHGYPSRCYDKAESIIMFTDSDPDYVKTCRNLIQRAQPEYAIVVGSEHVDLLEPFLDLIKDDLNVLFDL